MAVDTSKLRWDLESIFAGGSQSKEFEQFRQAITRDVEQAKARLAGLKRHLTQETFESWVEMFRLIQELDKRIHQAESFAYCLAAQDTGDEAAMGIIEQMSVLEAASEAMKTEIDGFAVAAEGKAWAGFVGDERLSGSAFYWNERRRNAKLKMEPALEKLATGLAVNGYHAWNRLYTKMAGDLRAELTEDGKTERLSLGQISNRMSSPDRDIRRQALEAIEAAWRSTESLAAMQLNSLAGFRLSLYEARGWDSPLFEPMLVSRVKRETIDAMWSSVAKGLDRIAEYVAAKKKIMGIDDFMWYDQFAPAAKIEKKFTYDEASAFVIKHLSSFSPELGEFAQMAIEKRWVEAEDRSGKMAGGFCTGLPISAQSRIFMTFSGNYDEMMTLAHELGHAYHSWVLKGHDYYARFYPMNLAETASTFNEMLVTDAALEAADTREAKMSLVDKKAQEHLIKFCNIGCRYIFESNFYEERKKGTVSKERLSELMVEAQKEAFGPILSEGGYHPLFWAAKLHFWETGMPFYNFPYTFGHLFAGGIYDRAKKEGKEFASKYRALLADTGSMTCEHVAGKHLDVDLSTEQFWHDAVDRALEDVETFIELAKA